jgi:galactofuranosylgalactofuranosylrhamnosyl-N-acetylglucosaminyl-diphospho-decaprenol beta-1,5/1,6-galactofuranosyltransferase
VGLLQRVQFPTRADNTGMYFRSDLLLRMGVVEGAPRLLLGAGEGVSANTYFNSFFLAHHAAHYDPAGAVYELDLEGDLLVRLVQENLDSGRTVLQETEVRGARPEEPVLLAIPPEARGRVYFELTARGPAAVCGGRVTTTAPEQPVRLAAIITSFKREVFVQANVARLMADPLLGEDFRVLVVDNGGTLTPEMFADPRVRLISNPNTGGAGGFSRGMLETLEQGWATHMLVMDDDIELPSESVVRTLAFFRHAGGKVAISGSMFDLEKPHHLHEAGARWNWAIDVHRPQPLKLLPLKNYAYVQSACALNGLMLEEPVDYGAFWFFAFPAEMVREQGCCLPFFVVGDDIEFGLRFTRRFGGVIRPLAGVAVWHVPFYFKLESLAPYFYFRNLLAVSAVHDRFTPVAVACRFLLEVFKTICIFDYLHGFRFVRGVEDFLKGPDALPDIEPPSVAKSIGDYKTANGLEVQYTTPDMTERPFDTDVREGILRTAMRWLTIGGHLLPDCMLNPRPASAISHRTGQWRQTFGHSKLQNLHRELFICWKRTMRRGVALGLAWRALRTGCRLALRWNALSAEWRSKSGRMCSPEFWSERLRGGRP